MSRKKLFTIKDTEREVVVVAKFRMNYNAIFDVAENDLGLKREVQIIREPEPDAKRFYTTYRGLYEHRSDDYAPHRIRIPVNMQLSPFDASTTVYHELMHAKQAERLGEFEFQRQYADETYAMRARWNEIQMTEKLEAHSRQWSLRWLETYFSNPFEREAEDYGQEQARKRLLCGLHGGGIGKCATIVTASS